MHAIITRCIDHYNTTASPHDNTLYAVLDVENSHDTASAHTLRTRTSYGHRATHAGLGPYVAWPLHTRPHHSGGHTTTGDRRGHSRGGVAQLQLADMRPREHGAA